jgi:hypothetical protein
VVLAAQLGSEHAAPLLDRLRGHLDAGPLFGAAFLEAEGMIERDKAKLSQAADLYAGMEMPYQEARAALEAGQLRRAESLIKKFGLENGPLGARAPTAATLEAAAGPRAYAATLSSG